MQSEIELKLFGEAVMKLIRKEDLSKEEANSCWKQIIKNEQPELQQGAFLAALAMKGETETEIAGSWEAIYELDTHKVDLSSVYPLVENCGTGMDTLKTFNISTAAGIIAAAKGVYLARHGARALSSKVGTVDVVEQFGVDVECSAELVKRSIEKAKIGLFNGMSSKIHPKALFRILSQIRFGSTLNIAGSLANPARPQYAVRGVFSEKMVANTIKTMKEIGYKKAMVFFGHDDGAGKGMDELSIIGSSAAAELDKDGGISYFDISPDEFGIKKSDYNEIKTKESAKDGAKLIVDILNGAGSRAQEDAVALNAAPILYIAGITKDIKEGFEMASEVIKRKEGIGKLKEWVSTQNECPETGLNKLSALLSA